MARATQATDALAAMTSRVPRTSFLLTGCSSLEERRMREALFQAVSEM